MDPGAARTARESLDLAFDISNILDTGLDCHTLPILDALCDMGLNLPPSPMGTTPSVTYVGNGVVFSTLHYIHKKYLL